MSCLLVYCVIMMTVLMLGVVSIIVCYICDVAPDKKKKKKPEEDTGELARPYELYLYH